MKTQLLFITGLLFAISAIGQQDQYQWRFGVQSGIMTYRGDINNEWLTPNEQLNNLGDNGDYLGYGIALEKNLSPAWGLRLLYTNGEFIANDRAVDWDGNLQLDADNFARALNVKTELSDWSLLLTYSLDNGYLLPKNAFFAPYLTVGLGYTDFQTYGDLLRVENARYYYWNDGTIRDVAQNQIGVGNIIEQDGIFETKLSDLNTEGEDYNTFLFQGTAGLGLKFRLGARFNLNLETLWRFTTSDYLDDVSGDYLDTYDSEFQQYAAIPGARTGAQRGNDNGKNDAYTFTSISLHYNFGRKKETLRVPEIRIGLLSEPFEDGLDRTLEGVSVLEDSIQLLTRMDTTKATMPVDTQAIFVLRQSLDSTYVVQTVDSLQLGVLLDTLMLVSDSIYVSTNPDSLADANNQFLLQEYLSTQEGELDSLGAAALTVTDTQYYFVVTERIDSILVLRDTQLLSQDLSAGNMSIDTFFQLGDTILRSDMDALITDDDWEILRDEILLTDDSTDLGLNYEDYLQSRISGPDTLMTEIESKIDVIPADFMEMPVRDSFTMDAGIPRNEKSDFNFPAAKIDSMMTQMLLDLERDLDSLKRTPGTEKWVVVPEQKNTPPNQAVVTTEPSNQEVLELRTKVNQLEQEMRRRDQEELAKVKEELEAYRSAERTKLQEENAKLQAELQALKNNSNPQPQQVPQQAAQRVEQPTVEVTVPPTPAQPTANEQELSQLRTEVSAMNENMELMKQLLLQQQVIASLNNQSAPVRPENNNQDSMAIELSKLRQEIAELRVTALQKDTTRQQPLVVTMPVKSDKAEMDSLKNQLLGVRQQLDALKKVKPAEPVVERVVVEVPVEKPVDVAEAIRGRSQQIVFFTIGSSKLSTSSMTQVQSIVQLMREFPTLQLRLDAYTDASGDASKNLALSKRRAEAVRAAITQAGINQNRIQMNFRGEDEQSDPAFGRRVEMEVYVPN